MADVLLFAAGGYRYVEDVVQYSAGRRPPVVGLDYGMDVCGIARELVL
jgi:hypothetical protein